VTPGARAVPTAAGHALGATFFAPARPPVGAVLIAPAMGVVQSFYAPLAGWLAEQGFVVATFDYQGMGRSRHGSLRAGGSGGSGTAWCRCSCRWSAIFRDGACAWSGICRAR
jgi:predicted alpha/beta hydrolase